SRRASVSRGREGRPTASRTSSLPGCHWWVNTTSSTRTTRACAGRCCHVETTSLQGRRRPSRRTAGATQASRTRPSGQTGRRMARSRATFLAALAVVVVLAGSGSARGVEPVEVDVSGTGWLQNRRLERSVERLRADPDAPVLTANGIEDAVFLLFSALSEDGYLQPRIQAELTRRDGTVFTHEFDPQLTRLLPRPLEVTRAKFSVERGVRFRFDDLQFEGDADGLTTEELQALLLPTGTALSVTVERDFSPAALRRGLGRIEDALPFRGFAAARAEEKSVTRDPETGDVDVVVAIDTGPRWWGASADRKSVV